MAMVMFRIIGLLFLIFATGAVGLICLFAPERVRAIAHWLGDHQMLSTFGMAGAYYDSKMFLFGLRISGGIALLISAFLIWASIKSS
jgi:hypothetical protein